MARLPGKIKAGGTGQPTKEGRDAQRPDFPGWYARDDIPDAGYDNDLATVKAVRDNGGGGGGAVDSVNGQTGDVVLDADDVGALESGDNISLLTNDAGYLATVASDSSLTGDGTAGSPLSVVGGGGAVDSVNGQTGVVVLDADDVGALATVATDATLTGDGTTGSPLSVVGGGGAVTSVNGQTGVVVLGANDVGALQSGDNVSELVNDAGYINGVATDATLTGDGTVGDPLSVVGSGSSLTVTDGTTTVNNVDEIQFTKANSVTDLTGGVVGVNNDGGDGIATEVIAGQIYNTEFPALPLSSYPVGTIIPFNGQRSKSETPVTINPDGSLTIAKGYTGLLFGDAQCDLGGAGEVSLGWIDPDSSETDQSGTADLTGNRNVNYTGVNPCMYFFDTTDEEKTFRLEILFTSITTKIVYRVRGSYVAVKAGTNGTGGGSNGDGGGKYGLLRPNDSNTARPANITADDAVTFTDTIGDYVSDGVGRVTIPQGERVRLRSQLDVRHTVPGNHEVIFCLWDVTNDVRLSHGVHILATDFTDANKSHHPGGEAIALLDTANGAIDVEVRVTYVGASGYVDQVNAASFLEIQTV